MSTNEDVNAAFGHGLLSGALLLLVMAISINYFADIRFVPKDMVVYQIHKDSDTHCRYYFGENLFGDNAMIDSCGKYSIGDMINKEADCE